MASHEVRSSTGLGTGHNLERLLMAGSYALRPTASSDRFSIEPLESRRLMAVVLAVNAGGALYTDKSGQTWSSDGGFETGIAVNKQFPVASTGDDSLYYTMRRGKSFNFAAKVKPG